MLYALSSVFSEGDELTFSLVDTVSGKFVQKYFESLRGCPKSPRESHFVIPAKAGIQHFRDFLDPGLRRGDGPQRLFDTLLAVCRAPT